MNICYEYLECVGYDNLFYAELLVNKALRKELLLSHQRSSISSVFDYAPDLTKTYVGAAVDDEDVLRLPIIRPLELCFGKKAPAAFDNSPQTRYKKCQQSAMVAYQRGSVAPRPCDSCQRGCGPFKQCIVIPNWTKGACANCRHRDKAARCTFRIELLKISETPNDESEKSSS
jgi:hypothetical protein